MRKLSKNIISRILTHGGAIQVNHCVLVKHRFFNIKLFVILSCWRCSLTIRVNVSISSVDTGTPAPVTTMAVLAEAGTGGNRAGDD